MMLKQTFDPLQKNADIVLKVTGLCGGPGDRPLFHGIDLQLPSGVSALLGDEGVGKTSLMRLLSGDLLPTAGQVRISGDDSHALRNRPPDVFWTDLRLPLHDNETPEQCWAVFRSSSPSWSVETQKELIENLQLSPHLEKKLNMMSTGTRRKVGLVTALACGATVTLLDQPFVSLDQVSIRNLKSFMAHAAQNSDRAWLIADYEEPTHLPLVSVLQL
jgi:ABC-type multidrug transport system ATPase subunit